ncbi:hypothetical protein Efla_004703 [Eimeria flavescens]
MAPGEGVFAAAARRWRCLPLGGRFAAAAASVAAAAAPFLLLQRQRRQAAAKSSLYTRSIKDCVYLDFSIGSKYAGRVLIGLYSDFVPLTAENFLQLCDLNLLLCAQGAAGRGYAGGRRADWLRWKRHLHLREEVQLSPAAAVAAAVAVAAAAAAAALVSAAAVAIPAADVAAAALAASAVSFAAGAAAAFAQYQQRSSNTAAAAGAAAARAAFVFAAAAARFPDENYSTEFLQDGDVAMVSSGPHSNNSQFLITFCPLPVLNRQHVVIEDVGTKNGVPMEPVRIIGCGLYRGPQDGPPFFSSAELLERADSPTLQKDSFMQLSPEEQEALVEGYRATRGPRKQRAPP